MNLHSPVPEKFFTFTKFTKFKLFGSSPESIDL